jgi:hypothetical protein
MEKPAFPTADTQKMLTLPMGAISPLWLMFAGAATVGAAYFWNIHTMGYFVVVQIFTLLVALLSLTILLLGMLVGNS